MSGKAETYAQIRRIIAAVGLLLAGWQHSIVFAIICAAILIDAGADARAFRRSESERKP